MRPSEQCGRITCWEAILRKATALGASDNVRMAAGPTRMGRHRNQMAQHGGRNLFIPTTQVLLHAYGLVRAPGGHRRLRGLSI